MSATPILTTSMSLGELLSSDGTALYTLTLLYAVMFVYAVRRGMLLRGSFLSPPRFFALSVTLAAGLRLLTFIICTMFSFDPSLEGTGGSVSDSVTRNFRLIEILFNSGDWGTINCYALLLLCTLELQLRTRANVFPTHVISRDWRIAFIVIALCVQLMQVGLYAAAFTTPDATASHVLVGVYATISAFNFTLPMLFFVGLLTSIFLFAGFPFRSPDAAAAYFCVLRLTLAWTFGRVAWAVLTIFFANGQVAAAVSSRGTWFFSLVIVTTFIFAELVQFFWAFGSEVMRALSVIEDTPVRGASASGGGAAVDSPRERLLAEEGGGDGLHVGAGGFQNDNSDGQWRGTIAIARPAALPKTGRRTGSFGALLDRVDEEEEDGSSIQ